MSERGGETTGAAAAGARAPAGGADAGERPAPRRVLHGLLEQTGCPRALLWTPRGTVEVGGAGPTATPDAGWARRLLAEGRALDLGSPRGRELLGGGPRGWAAAVALTGSEGVLVLSEGPRDPAGGVRRHTLAALEGAALTLDPRPRASAWERLGRVDGELQRLDRLASLGGLVAEIVHEIRNPLVSVKTFLQLLPEQWGDPDFRGEFLDVATDELRRVERLLDVVLEHARPARGARVTPGDEIDRAIESVIQLVAHRAAERNVQLVADLQDDLPELPLSADSLRQVLLNLSLNALAVTPDAGTVTLRARRRADGVEIEVDDEGPGVPEALRERIFEPFFSTRDHKPGGLGLAISRRIAEEAGGSLVVEGRPEGGARFRARLPAVEDGRAASAPQGPENP